MRGLVSHPPFPRILCYNVFQFKSRGFNMVEKLKALFVKYNQFLRFCVVGAANTLITWVISYLLMRKLNMDTVPATIIAYSAGILNGYIWSTRAVFKTKGTAGNLTKFIIVNALMIGLNTVLVLFFSSVLKIDGFIAQIIATPFTLVGNFILNKFWTFKPEKK
jgi:putative flippase GtrA